MKCVQILLPALIENEEQEKMTKRCKKSLISFDQCVKLTVDKKKYPAAVAGVWNTFLDKWRGKDYDYLMITANDTEADPHAIDYMVRCAEENSQAGIITGHVTRDYDDFKKNYGQYEYTSSLTVGAENIDPACFLIRKGLIEKLGRIDEEFPCEFVERDYIYRAKLAGYDVIEPAINLWYHPPYAGTIGNDSKRLQRALRKYMSKWGGDANKESYLFPYNDARLDFTYCNK